MEKIEEIIKRIKSNVKIELPKDVEWKEFVVGEIFDVYGSKTTAKQELEEIGKGEYPYITTQATNNGCFDCYNFWTELGNCLTIDSAVLGTCFYQEKNFTASDHVEILRPKYEKFNKNIGLFVRTIISKTTKNLYNYTNKFNQNKIKNTKILLPSKNNEPDWEYMDKFIESTRMAMRLDFSTHTHTHTP